MYIVITEPTDPCGGVSTYKETGVDLLEEYTL